MAPAAMSAASWEVVNELASERARVDDEDFMERAVDILRDLGEDDYSSDLEKCAAVIKSAQKILEVIFVICCFDVYLSLKFAYFIVSQ